MAAPQGNQNAAKAKVWSAAIERALERQGDPTINPDSPIERSPKAKALDAMADKFVAAGMAGPSYEKGDPWLGVIKEFADRMEGKPAQSVTLAGDPEAPLETKMEVRLVKPGA